MLDSKSLVSMPITHIYLPKNRPEKVSGPYLAWGLQVNPAKSGNILSDGDGDGRRAYIDT